MMIFVLNNVLFFDYKQGVVAHMISHGGARGGIEMKDQYGRTALAAAAQADKVDNAKFIIFQAA